MQGAMHTCCLGWTHRGARLPRLQSPTYHAGMYTLPARDMYALLALTTLQWVYVSEPILWPLLALSFPHQCSSLPFVPGSLAPAPCLAAKLHTFWAPQPQDIASALHLQSRLVLTCQPTAPPPQPPALCLTPRPLPPVPPAPARQHLQSMSRPSVTPCASAWACCADMGHNKQSSHLLTSPPHPSFLLGAQLCLLMLHPCSQPSPPSPS